MSTVTMSLTEVQALIGAQANTTWPQLVQEATAYGFTAEELSDPQFINRMTGGAFRANYAKDGTTVLSYSLVGEGQNYRPNLNLNSNTTSIARAEVTAPASTAVNSAGKVTVSRLSGVGTKVATAAAKVSIPVALASVGITLGKTVDETLYNANPDWFNQNGLWAFNPQTWSSLAGGDDTLGGQFLNMIFGIDPNTGDSTAYMDAAAFAHLAYGLNANGFFSNGIQPQTIELNKSVTKDDIIFGNANDLCLTYLGKPIASSRTAIINSEGVLCCGLNKFRVVVGNVGSYWDSRGYPTHFIMDDTCHISSVGQDGNTGSVSPSVVSRNDISTTNQSFLVLEDTGGTTVNIGTNSGRSLTAIANTQVSNNAFLMYYVKLMPVLPGVGNQPGATIPDFGTMPYEDYLPYLQDTYPDMFNDAIHYPVVQPDGSVNDRVYIPVTLPNADSLIDTQPTSSSQSQQNPNISPTTSPDYLTDLVADILQQPYTQPMTETPTPPQNPTETGTGSTPTPQAPTGNASALWAIYHPSQSQVDSFGAWLWSPNFIDQIAKIFNNPMESIIGLHKVFITPVDAGTSTIHVGYLDSNVPSAYVTQQYVYKDCGDVDLNEYFGNVLDYDPHTKVKLYLPFIGIVQLNTSEVMRSSINVEYGVDVLTGACLAIVTVTRDNNEAVLYQYSGNCSVQYPLSSGSYMGIVSSILSVAGSAVATFASGGSLAPLTIGAASAALNAHTNVQNSGSFSGNSGAMGGKIPYLIIERPQSHIANNIEQFDGYPSNDYITIGNCTGFVKCDNAHILGVNATNSELDEIMSYLIEGIIV